MKHLYRLLLLCGGLAGAIAATAQNWRPFRPNGDVHAFRSANPAAADTVLTMRLDSAGVSGSDSVYYFNRTMRRAGSYGWQKSRNNQFGKTLRYTPATRTYTLFWDGGPTPILTLDRSLVLKPFAPIGSTWSSMFTDYGVQTTLVSRGTMLLDGVMDSIVTFQTSAPRSSTIVLSKSFGLVSAPVDIDYNGISPKRLTLARRPSAAGISYYNPLTLLDLQPGDELGYEYMPYSASPFSCYTGYTLKKILTRQVTADSVVYTFQQQTRDVYNGAPGCPPAGTIMSPVTRGRIAASRRSGLWRGADFTLPWSGELLTYGYRMLGASSTGLMMGHPIVATRPGVPCSGPATLMYETLYQQPNTTNYLPGLDAQAWQQHLAEGVGVVRHYGHQLTYTRRTTASGTVQTCGSRTNFATLLPTQAARTATPLQVYPNPAAGAATLRLPAPASAGTTARLLDALGREVRRQPIASGQTAAEIRLHDLAAGLYLVEVQAPGQAPQRVRVQHAAE